MTIQINGTSGISGVDGSAATPALQGTDSNTGISFGTDEVNINTGGTTAVTVDSSQRVGIGTASPTNTDKLEIQTSSTSAPGLWVQTGGTTSAYPIADFRTGSNLSALQLRGDGASVFSGRLLVGTSTAASNYRVGTTSFTPKVQAEGTDVSPLAIQRTDGPPNLFIATGVNVASGGDIGKISFNAKDGTNLVQAATIGAECDGTPGTNDMPGRLVFSTTRNGSSSPTSRVRITEAGSMQLTAAAGIDCFYSTTPTAAGTSVTIIRGGHSATDGSPGSGTDSFYVFANGNVQNTNNSYGQISDVKLKENIVDANSQWDDLKAVRVRNFNFKKGQTHKQIGVIAQELEESSPGLVYETPDRDGEGNETGEVTKGVNYSVLYMKAVKALQEAMERIEALETRVAQLEGGTN